MEKEYMFKKLFLFLAKKNGKKKASWYFICHVKLTCTPKGRSHIIPT